MKTQSLQSTVFAGVFTGQPLQEASFFDLYGYSVPLYREYQQYDGRVAWTQDYWPERHITQWTITQLDIARRDAKYLAETNPEAAGILQQLANYTVGSGSALHYSVPDDDSEEPSPDLEKRCRKIINKFRRINMWECLELEAIIRLHRDGEYFLRLYPNEETGITDVRFIEPVQIRPPIGQDHNGPWSWGCHTPTYDNWKPTKYNIHNWWTSEDEEVDAQYIVHHKINCTRNNKRGFSSFYACALEMNGARDVRSDTREGERTRAKVAFIRQHAVGTSKGMVQTFHNQQITEPALDRSLMTGGTAPFDYQKSLPEVRDIPNGMEYKDPPKSPNSESSGLSVKQALMAVGSRFGVPYAFISGESDSSFASMLVQQSPMTVKIEADQRDLARYMREVFCRVLSIAEYQEQLPFGVEELIAPDVAFKSPIAINELDATKRRLMLVKAKLMSQHTACSEEGLEFEVEQAHMVSEPELPEFDDGQKSEKDEQPKTMGGKRQAAEN